MFLSDESKDKIYISMADTRETGTLSAWWAISGIAGASAAADQVVRRRCTSLLAKKKFFECRSSSSTQ
jgi:hypothetical protein